MIYNSNTARVIWLLPMSSSDTCICKLMRNCTSDQKSRTSNGYFSNNFEIIEMKSIVIYYLDYGTMAINIMYFMSYE